MLLKRINQSNNSGNKGNTKRKRNSRIKSKKVSIKHIIGIIISIACTVNVGILFAQNTQTTSDKADNNLKSSVRVNPVTFAMEFSLPLGGHPGRAGNSKPIAISYSSKVWEMEQKRFRSENLDADFHPEGYGTNPAVDRVIFNVSDIYAQFSKNKYAGWSSSLQPMKIIEERDFYNQYGYLYQWDIEFSQSFNTNCQIIEFGGMVPNSGCSSGWGQSTVAYCEGPACEVGPQSFGSGGGGCYTTGVLCGAGGGSNGNGNPTSTPTPTPTPIFPTHTPTPQVRHDVKRYKIQMPQGTTHEFRQADVEFDCQEASYNCLGNIDTGTFLSVDGSGMRLERNEDQGNNLIRDVLYMPGGGRYIFYPNGGLNAQSNEAETPVEKYIDKNGNISTYDYENNIWTDTLGREIKDPLHFSSIIPYQIPNQPQVYTTKGINGQDINYTLDWKKLENVFEKSDTELHYPGFDQCTNELDSAVSGGKILFKKVTPYDSYIDSGNGAIEVVNKQRICSPSDAEFNPVVLGEVILPNGQKYQFKYNEYAEITKIIYPTGGYERFEYDKVEMLGAAVDATYAQGNRGVKKHYVSYDGANELIAGKYYDLYDAPQDYRGQISVAPDESRSEIDVYKTEDSRFGFENPLSGRTIESRTFDASGQIRSRTLNKYVVEDGRVFTDADDVVHQPNPKAKRDPRLQESISIVFEPGESKALMTKSKTVFDSHTEDKFFAHLNPKRSESTQYVAVNASSAAELLNGYDYFDPLFASAPLASVTETDYVYDQNYLNEGILGLPTATFVLNPANPNRNAPGGVLAKTQAVYDNILPNSNANYGYSVQGYGGVGASFDCSADPQNPKICWEDQANSRKGRPTTTRLWDDDNNIWIESHTQYDIFGNAVRTKDHLNRESSAEFGSQYKYAYPTGTTAPAPGNGTSGTSEQFKTETNYDFTTGLVLWTKDLRGLGNAGDDLVTSYEYNDAMLRPTAVVAPNGLRSETIYNDAPGNLWVKTRAQFDANIWNEATVYVDGLGRTLKTRTTDASGDVIVETKYDDMSRVSEVSNPYREGAAATNILWSKTEYDAAGRVATVYSPKPYGQTGDSIGTNEYGIINEAGLTGVWQVSIDASGRKKRTVTNSLGQLARVDEAMAFGGTIDNDLGTLSNPKQPTSYKYDIKGNMVEVTQGKPIPGQYQKRNFLYDSLGRLIRVKQPEQDINASLGNKTDPVTGNSQWTAGFKYNAAGNLEETTDAEGNKITNTYDNADRVLTRSYSDGITPTVSYKYDLAPNGKGALIETSNSVSTSKTTQFDQWGRATEYQQVTDGVAYTSKYKYNLSGALVEEEYPSGRVVKNDFDANGDLSRVWGINGQVQQTFANSFKYTAAGGISAMKLGNGRWETAKFNERLQVTELGLGHSATDAGVWKVNYEFGELDANGDIIAGTNTGNIARQTTSFNGLSQPFVQSYKYDALYRLTEAVETSGTTTENWRQNFTYDHYGNRLTHQKYLNGSFIAQDNQTHPNIDPATNRFTTGQGYTYDLNGNLIADAEGRQFTFNADNKQTLVMNGTVKVGEYFYDGDGKRIKKKTFHENGVLKETTVFVYSGGKLIAEYSTTPPPAQGKTKYLTEDHLGTPRIITDATGQVIARRDFLPFGEEIYSTVGERSAQSFKYGASEDDVKQKFTGYQKDNETQLDFAEARMYENRHARFTAVDPLLASGKSANPQTFNRFVYVGNNPINITDPLGLDWYYDGYRAYRWSSDNKTFDNSEDKVSESWSKISLGENGFYVYPGCINSECSSTEDAVLLSSGQWKWVKDLENGEVGTESSNSRTFLMGNGWIARVDQFNEGGEGNFEIHVGRGDKNGNISSEYGIVKGEDGWVTKHGNPSTRPDGIPDDIVNKTNGINVEELRRRGRLPSRGEPKYRQAAKNGAYLRPGRVMTGTINFINIADGFLLDYETYLRGQRNGLTFNQQRNEDLRNGPSYNMTIFGPLPNPHHPCFPNYCEEWEND